jgi:hypothetical protein
LVVIGVLEGKLTLVAPNFLALSDVQAQTGVFPAPNFLAHLDVQEQPPH